ncbi:hypothetical protein E0Z10_g5248 [Xylaria hypoxylon]|uniref:Mitotic apparatus protein p62 n=1 Tax=Xylaria hypoxylon TaxID=37992 RepID=A0A4Z0YJ79_9PEZI|nr:hypothetical protein E0Z10_g5248 [Xylaria hypoxylon]
MAGPPASPTLPVLRFPISGRENDSFLVEVSSNGSRPLDLKLTGSESTAVFLVKLRHKKIDEYKSSPGHCTDEEWQQILTSIFVDLKPVLGIEVRADVQSDDASVTLSFRKNIQGITQRLGSINLDENDRTEISPFDWCVSAIASRTKVTEELAAATVKIESLEQSIEELKAQLDDFITTKEEDETQMLEKFRDLLNSKKVKIRQQHRLLAAAKVDPEKLAKIGGDDQDAHRNAGPSRSGKRKAPVKMEDESDDDFERMDVDKQDPGDNADTNSQPESDSDGDENQQLSTDNDATASDPDTDDEPPTAAEVKKKGVTPPGRITKPKASVSKRTTRSSQTARATAQKQPAVASDSEDEDDELPPPRVLPFMAAKKTAPPPKPADDDETPSDDDDSEL